MKKMQVDAWRFLTDLEDGKGRVTQDILVLATPFRTRKNNRPAVELDIMGMKICIATHDLKQLHEAAKELPKYEET